MEEILFLKILLIYDWIFKDRQANVNSIALIVWYYKHETHNCMAKLTFLS